MKKKKKKKIVGWSTKMLDEMANKHEFEKTEQMVQWTRISQEDTNGSWKTLCRKMEDEVLEKYKNRRGQAGCVQWTW